MYKRYLQIQLHTHVHIQKMKYLNATSGFRVQSPSKLVFRIRLNKSALRSYLRKKFLLPLGAVWCVSVGSCNGNKDLTNDALKKNFTVLKV